MNAIRRSALLGALLVTLAVGACSAPGAAGNVAGSSTSGSGATAGSGSGSTAGSVPGSGSSSAAAGQKTAAGSATVQGGTSTSGNSARRAVKDPRASMPSVAAAPVAGIGYGTATAPARARFAPVSAASGGLIVANTIRTLTVSGTDVGSVGVFRIKPGLGASPMFQDQFVVQVMNAVAGKASAPKFVRIDGQVVALATGPAAVAGWFEGDHVVLVYRNGGRPDLNSLALAVKNAPAGRSLPAPAPTPPAE